MLLGGKILWKALHQNYGFHTSVIFSLLETTQDAPNGGSLSSWLQLTTSLGTNGTTVTTTYTRKANLVTCGRLPSLTTRSPLNVSAVVKTYLWPITTTSPTPSTNSYLGQPPTRNTGTPMSLLQDSVKIVVLLLLA